jgi:hypothetical protein
MKKCKECGKGMASSNNRNIYCSRSCSATHNNRLRMHTEETRRKISYSIQVARLDGRSKTPTESKEKTPILNTCIVCSIEFDTNYKPSRKTCSIDCKERAYKLGLYNFKGKLGGYRKGSGRGKSGWYKGIWCDSSYELAWVIYHIENNIPFERNKESFQYEYNGEIHLYYPDFRLKESNELVEIKGFYTEQTHVKLKSVTNTKLTVIDKQKIQPYIDYVTDRYGKNFVSLYESP